MCCDQDRSRSRCQTRGELMLASMVVKAGARGTVYGFTCTVSKATNLPEGRSLRRLDCNAWTGNSAMYKSERG